LEEKVSLDQAEGHCDFGWFGYEEALNRLTRFPEQPAVFEQVCKKRGLAR